MKTNCVCNYLFLLVPVLTFLTPHAKGQTIDRFAGTGQPGFNGDNGPAINAKLSYPYHLSSDVNGNIYIADMNNAAIRKVNSAGIITTIAGARTAGYTGDGGPAVLASLNYPLATDVDLNGNIFIVDQGNFVIRKITANGIISTVAGNGTKGYSGDGGTATNAQLSFPTDIAVDKFGNLYIADQEKNVVRKVDNNGIISTFAGDGTAGYVGDGTPAISSRLNKPVSVAVDNSGNVYVADQGNVVIRKINSSGIITTYAGKGTFGFSGDGGMATAAQFSINSPIGLATDNDGNLYVSDYQNHIIRMINTSGMISTIAGIPGVQGGTGNGGPALEARLWFPVGITVDPCKNVYFSEPFNSVIRKISFSPVVSFSIQPADVQICQNNNAQYHVRAENADSYEWQAYDGTNWLSLTDNAVYSGTLTKDLQIFGAVSQMDNQQYRCIAKNSCSAVASGTAVLHILKSPSPNVNIVASNEQICYGSEMSFTANTSNASNITYQWKKNGVNVGTGSMVYKASDLVNGDRIDCSIEVIDNCDVRQTATSNTIIANVTQAENSSVSISSSTTTACANALVSFTASAVNAGNSPVYKWTLNGAETGTNSPGYEDNTFKDGDVVQCTVIADNICRNTFQSNSVVLKITSPLTPSVSIATLSKEICAGGTVHLIATASNCGSSPAYQWFCNGAAVGDNTNIYDEKNFSNAESIFCKVSTGIGCFTKESTTSSPVQLTVLPAPIVLLDHTNTLCEGTLRQLQAGTFSSYSWNDGSTAQTLMINRPGTYYVTVVDNNGCKGSDTTRIISMLPAPSGFLPADSFVCPNTTLVLQPSYWYTSYLWSTGSTDSILKITKPGSYWLQVTDHNNCKGKAFITIASKECLSGFYIPTAFTPNNDGKNDTFKPLVYGILKTYNFRIYDRWGQIVFHSRDVKKGWNGILNGKAASTNAYVWICCYQLEGGQVETKKGTMLLIK